MTGTSPVMTTLAALSLRLWNLFQVLYVAEPSNTFRNMAQTELDKSQGVRFHWDNEDRTIAKESKATQDDVKRAMHKRKEGTLKSGRSGRTVKSKKQAIAIGLSETRAKGKNVPAKKAS